MSNTIQTRPYSAKQASLLQCRPSALIEDAESHGNARSNLAWFSNASAVTALIARGGEFVSPLGTGASPGHSFLLISAHELAATGDVAVEPVAIDSDVWSHWAKTVKEAFQVALADPRPVPTAAARLRVQRLSALQAALGLPTRDLAGVLGISRQALYQWLDASRDIKLQEASRTRLASVERIAKSWRERSNTPLGAIANEMLEGGRTILSRLTDADISEDAVLEAFGEILAKLQGRPKSRSQKLAEAGFKRRPSPRSLPSDE